jgi:hypothetical protein
VNTYFTHEFTVEVIDGDESVRISIYTLLDCTSDSFLAVNLLSSDQTLALSRNGKGGQPDRNVALPGMLAKL